MTYRKEIKLLYRRKKTKFFLPFILFVFILFFTNPCHSQAPGFHFSNRTLAEALTIISDHFETTIAFDSRKLGEVVIDKNISKNSISDILEELLEGTGFTFIKKYGNYLIVNVEQGQETEPIPVYNLIGVITDKESGENLSFANIMVNNQNTVVSATVNGTFAINKMLSDKLFLQISHLGYESIDTIIYLTGPENNCSICLQKKAQMLEEVSIKTEKLRIIASNDEASHTTITPASLVDFPNLGETDVFRSLQFLPGIGISENSSKLNIRGGSADQNLVLFDGFTLYNLDHFFGTFSSINPNVIKDIQVFKSGFDSRYGERLSGIVDITGKSGNKLKPKVYGGLNMVNGNITTEIPFSEKLTLVASARRSYSDMYSSYLMDLLFEQQIQPTRAPQTENSSVIAPTYYFYDLYSKLTYQKNEKESFSVSVYGGKDYLDNSNTSIGNTLNTITSDFNKWENYGVSASWLRQWKNNLFTNFQIGSSGYFNKYYNETSFSFKPGSQPPSTNTSDPYKTNESNKLNDYSATLKNTFLIDTKNQLDFGLAAKNNWYSYFKDGNDDFVYDDRESTSWLYTCFAQNTSQSLKNWKIKTGFRLNYYQTSGKLYFEPRVSGTRAFGDHFVAKFSTGRYYQFLSKVSVSEKYGYNRDFWVISDGGDHPVLSSNQYIIGGSYKSGNIYVDVETYYKTLNGLQSYQYFSQYTRNFDNQGTVPPANNNQPRTKSYFSTGSGDAYGMDLMVKYEGPGYTGWVSYSLAKAVQRFSNINNNSNIPAPFDQRHGLTFTNMYRYKKWCFSASCIFTTGHPYIVDETVDLDFVTTRSYGNLPNYQRFDIAANYNFKLKKSKFKVGLSIINLFDTQNYNDIYTRKFEDVTNSAVENTYVQSLGLTPNFFINFDF